MRRNSSMDARLERWARFLLTQDGQLAVATWARLKGGSRGVGSEGRDRPLWNAEAWETGQLVDLLPSRERTAVRAVYLGDAAAIVALAHSMPVRARKARMRALSGKCSAEVPVSRSAVHTTLCRADSYLLAMVAQRRRGEPIEAVVATRRPRKVAVHRHAEDETDSMRLEK